MTYKSAFCLYLTFVAMIGCAVPKPPELIKAPAPPEEWKAAAERNFGCPVINGEYELKPTVAVFHEDSSWEMSLGKSYDLVLLLPLRRVKGFEQTLDKDSSVNAIKGLLFKSDSLGNTLQITHKHENSESYVTHILKKADQDYRCEAGSLVFPEFVIQGGSEGATLSGRVHRQATKTLSGDLLFYKQVRGYETIHTYYIFKSMSN